MESIVVFEEATVLLEVECLEEEVLPVAKKIIRVVCVVVETYYSDVLESCSEFLDDMLSAHQRVRCV